MHGVTLTETSRQSSYEFPIQSSPTSALIFVILAKPFESNIASTVRNVGRDGIIGIQRNKDSEVFFGRKPVAKLETFNFFTISVAAGG